MRTPLPAITNGARAWTTPGEPCSPRWPPWSSQLWAAEWITQRSGAAGWSKSWAIGVVREGVGVLGPVGELVGELVVERRELVGGLVGERIGTGGGDQLVAVPARARAAEHGAAVVAQGLVGAVAAEQHHVHDGLEGAVQEDRQGPVGVRFEVAGKPVGGFGGGHGVRVVPDCWSSTRASSISACVQRRFDGREREADRHVAEPR